MRIAVAEPQEYFAALRLLFAHLPADNALARVQSGYMLLEEPSEPPGRLLVAREGGALVGAVLAQVLPGATGVLWPPCAAAGAAHPQRIEDALLLDALVWLRRGGARLAQAVLAHEDAHLGTTLLRGGFTQPTQLVYLQREPLEWAKEPGWFQNYLKASRLNFHELLSQTYEGSLDFPEIDGRRSLREVLQGYQAAGYDPAHWWLRHDERGHPVGVVILSIMPERIWDLTYVGVIPAARGRGHGRALVRKALAEAHFANAAALTVSVDARNEPALRLYRELGFEEFDRREVFLMADLAT